MIFLWNLAVKNLFRNKLRTFISILAIAFSVMMVVILRGFVVGMVDSMFKLNIQYDSGHIKIIKKEYEQKQRLLSLNYPVDGFNGAGITKMQDSLKEIPGVKKTIPRIKFGAAYSTEDNLIRMMGWGVNSAKEIQFTEIEDYLIKGRMIKPRHKEIIVGTELLDKLDAAVGDKITLVYTTSWGSFKGTTVKIVGEIKSGFKLLDQNSFYIPLNQAQSMLDMPDRSTELLLETNNYRKVDQVIRRVRGLFEEKDKNNRYQVIRWDQGNSIIQYLKVAKNIYNLVYVFVILLASVVVINTMTMIIKERTQEIGMMGALGFKHREILYLFIMEGIVIGLVGSLLGVVGGGAVTKILSIVGIDYSAAMAEVEADILMRPVIYPVLEYSNLLFSFILGTVITAITCIIPARKAARLDPSEALRSS